MIGHEHQAGRVRGGNQPSEDSNSTRAGVTAALLARYDQQGPRYTSYPTAVEFHEGFTVRDYELALGRANQSGEPPLSIYVHLPFCRARCLFCACNVIISPEREPALPYLDLLRTEVDMVAERLSTRRQLVQLHLGGGTPTYYRPQELTALVEHVFDHFQPVRGAELAVEVDPRVTTFDHIDALADLGFNRISLGVQDLDPKVQESIARVQSLEQTRALVDRARLRGFRGINVDLIYGLPHQSGASFERTVEEVIALGIDRSAVYSFAFVPQVGRQQKRLPAEALPSRDEKFALFATARGQFLAAGYEAIGMDHFARHDDELAVARRERRLQRNFQGYTVLAPTDVIGLGISAIGDVAGAYSQNHKKLSRYEAAVACRQLPVLRGVERTPDDEVRRAVIQQVMCNLHVDKGVIEQLFGVDFDDYFACDLERLRRHELEGLVEIGDDGIRVTPTGSLFVRNLAMCFDRYWRQRHEASRHKVFSRTV